jgi:hypothetical protein
MGDTATQYAMGLGFGSRLFAKRDDIDGSIGDASQGVTAQSLSNPENVDLEYAEINRKWRENGGCAGRKEVTPSISQRWSINALKNLVSSFGSLKLPGFRTVRLRTGDLHRSQSPQIFVTPLFNLEDV